MKAKKYICLSIILLSLAVTVWAEDTASESNIAPRLSTDQVENQIILDKEVNPLYESRLLSPLRNWRDGLAEKTGFNWSIDYSALFMGLATVPAKIAPAVASHASLVSGIWSTVADPTKAV